MAFEIGENQKNELEKYLKSIGITNYKFEKDMVGKNRYLFIFE